MSFLANMRRMLGVLLIVAACGLILPVSAQEQGASGLQISPTKHEISIEPGEVKDVSFIVKNITGIEITAKMALNDFESDDLTGEPKLIIDTKERNSFSLDRFLKGLADVDLKPGESKEVKVTIDIPGDAAPGGYYGAIRFDVTPKGGRQESGRQVALTASVAPLILVQVNGDITEQIDVKSVRAQRDDRIGSFFFSPPNKVATTIENLGNSFSRPFGRIAVQDMRGKEVFTYELNNTSPRGNILPKSTRTFTDDIEGVKTPGRYRLLAAIAHGNGGEVINYQSTFWYVPAWLILLLVTLLAVLLGGGYIVYRRKFGKPLAKKNRR